MIRYYFDHNATTPVDPHVAGSYAQAAADLWGNPSSVHRDGQRARHRLEQARAGVAELVGAAPKETIFTSGGTEADNLAVLGWVRNHTRPRKHVITTAIEHPAVLHAFAQLEREGIEVTRIPVDSRGLVDPDDFRRTIVKRTVLVSVMHANNETGVIQPIAEIARIAHELGTTIHSDGVQAAGKIPIDLPALDVDFYSISGHKFYAPKGIGALYARNNLPLQPLQFGGRHENGRRAGTENVSGAVAMDGAASLVAEHLPAEAVRLAALRDRLESGILNRIPDVAVNGDRAQRTPNTTNICFDGIDGEAMVIALDLRGFAVSTGAACSSGAVEPSHVLLAMGLSRDQAKSSLRFSLGRSNDEAQVDALIDAVADCAAHLRHLSPTYAHA